MASSNTNYKGNSTIESVNGCMKQSIGLPIVPFVPGDVSTNSTSSSYKNITPMKKAEVDIIYRLECDQKPQEKKE